LSDEIDNQKEVIKSLKKELAYTAEEAEVLLEMYDVEELPPATQEIIQFKKD